MTSSLLQSFLKIIIIFFMIGCANIKQPTGGPEDKEPPKLEKAFPENNSTNFKGNKIVLNFDEYVDAQKLRENMIISPIVDGGFEVVTKKKTVTIKFLKPLKENTTYSIGFGESIKDVTKGNFTKNLTLAFSTGPVIDSLIITGTVIEFISQSPQKEISIQVYDTKDTNTIINSKPLYYTKTDATGRFILRNMKEGTYNIYALQDVNKNYTFDKNKEQLAYIKNLYLTKDNSELKFGLTLRDDKKPEIISSKQENDYYLLTVNKGIKEYQVTSTSNQIYSDYISETKKIKIFNNTTTKDSLELFITLKDSSDNINSDTVKIAFSEQKIKNKKVAYTIKTEKNTTLIIKNETIKFILPKPLSKINYDSIEIKKDSSIIVINENHFKIDSNKIKIVLDYNYNFKDSLLIKFKKGAIISINSDTLSASTFKFKYKNNEDYGILSGSILCKEENYIFQLLDQKNKVIQSGKNMTTFYYDYLEPGEYKLKIIIDINNNDKWDPLDIENDIPPETIIYYKEKINLRANWEIIDLKFEIK